MNRALLGSAAIHVVLVALALVAARTAPRIVAGPDVVQVALLESPVLGAVAPAPAPRETPRRDEAVLEPAEDVGVRVQPPRRPRPAPSETPPEPVEPPASAAPFVALGPTGLRGQVALEGADFAFNYYLLLVRNRIAQGWSPPNGIVAGGQPVRCVVYFRIGRDGRLSAIRLETGSGVAFFDRSALRAVVLADPMPPLPDGYASDLLGVHFGFEYTAP